ncbi:FtsW/RodA/SpoVE family cell cycle protein [Heliophilum fasciatum]|uniref:Cell division protein FtsW (Lipid II flippase) n=1 Tax=Heliophilum fasciatum TaxID=35700 RepID=A0A4V2SWJ7_9FIRM|nr:FtsW/RodA/SpoVE family cell cycle protein [Heliophilum fasciatum]MCW2278714.1 cell division protein FtsW (lipid II flippase) [Heliophilum fasciatum]TCP62546.1 cell division protein FtsW (lipid II flippase) [Heliophilum fasciatum]
MGTVRDVKIDEYIEKVCSQIKFREVHQEIKLELKGHLEELIEELLSDGLSEEQAVDKAILQMGSFQSLGKKLNEIHKPKPEWSILSLSLIFLIISIFSMYLIERQGILPVTSIFTRSLIFMVIGMLMVTGFYLFDYRKLEPYSRHIYWGISSILFLTIIFGSQVNGKSYFSIAGISIDVVEISPMLFAVALAGIFKNWNWSEKVSALQGLALCIIPVALIISSGSFSSSMIMFVACITLMIVTGAGVLNYLSIFGFYSLTILAFVIMYKIQGFSVFVFSIGTSQGAGIHTDFVFTYILHTFGWVVSIVLIALIIIFHVRLLKVIGVAKNNYAKLMINGFISIFAVQYMWNILMNLGFVPITGIGLPFISYGGSQLLLNAMSLGLISSIYRRRNISSTI